MRIVVPAALLTALVGVSAVAAPSAAAPSVAAPLAGGSVSEKLAAYIASERHYRAIRRDVLAWHKTSRNGCVAYASTALRHVGVAIGERDVRDGWGVSRITFAFSDHLEELGWQRVDDSSRLRPGDLVFTSGAPDHVFIFARYGDRKRRTALAVDNQGFMKRRPLSPRRGSKIAAFAYALRSP